MKKRLNSGQKTKAVILGTMVFTVVAVMMAVFGNQWAAAFSLVALWNLVGLYGRVAGMQRGMETVDKWSLNIIQDNLPEHAPYHGRTGNPAKWCARCRIDEHVALLRERLGVTDQKS